MCWIDKNSIKQMLMLKYNIYNIINTKKYNLRIN